MKLSAYRVKKSVAIYVAWACHWLARRLEAIGDRMYW